MHLAQAPAALGHFEQETLSRLSTPWGLTLEQYSSGQSKGRSKPQQAANKHVVSMHVGLRLKEEDSSEAYYSLNEA